MDAINEKVMTYWLLKIAAQAHGANQKSRISNQQQNQA
jgi:hypothetical protein